MIAGIFHEGSGLGNQLHRYLATRCLAGSKGCDWGMCNPQLFKGDSFMKIDKGINPPCGDVFYYPDFYEKKVVENGVDIRGYDPEINFVKDNTLIDGEFQDERYWQDWEEEISDWLKVEPLEVPDDVCVIGFRGGEYVGLPDLYLTRQYWEDAVNEMYKINPLMKFEVHTDDIVNAVKMLEELLPSETPFIFNMENNWRSMRFAKHAIIANSSFYILPRWLRKGITIAPRYWARHNTKVWALPQNYYSRFKYI
jgi:hypothetical protein